VASLDAQTIEGTVAVMNNGDPVPMAQIVLSEDGTDVGETVADQLGRFSIRAPAAGQYRVLARGLGFRPGVSSFVAVADGETGVAQVDLFRIAVQLDEISIDAVVGQRYLETAGFYRRRANGLGRFLDREAIENRLPVSVQATDLLRGIPGIRIIPSQYAGEAQRIQVTIVPSALKLCDAPRIFVDGYLISGPIDEFVAAQDVEGIEVFRRPAEVPPEYGGGDTGCGVVLFWTRRRQ
jgi:Carboxypeptidase regulatory-like domain/TonB-dependent Receptor Plug Domain